MASPTAQQIVEHALSMTSADHCVVMVKHTTSANLRWANNTLTTNGAMAASSVTVVAVVEGSQGASVGSVSGAATTLDQVSLLVRAADAAAHAAGPAEDTAPLAPSVVDPGWELPPETTDIGIYAELSPTLGEAFTRAEANDRILYGFVDHQVETVYLGSSTGTRRRHAQPMGYVSCTGKTADLQQSAWFGRATRDFTDIDPLDIEDTLATRLGWAARSLTLPAGRYDTILPPAAVADLSIYALWVAAARTAHEGQSVYGRPGGGTRIGERIARPGVNVFSDPRNVDLACAPFVVAPASGIASSVFDNGLPLQRTDWIRDGVLDALLQTRHTAELTGQPTTPMIDNLIVDTGGQGSVEDQVTATERGLLLTCLWYIREVDPQSLLLTGLTRDGVYLVENGEVVGAVNNFRFNESPIDLLNRFTGSSASIPSFSREWGDYFPWTSTPALRIPDFNMSSVSQAT
jgi:predicted Zn-dependent protease